MPKRRDLVAWLGAMLACGFLCPEASARTRGVRVALGETASVTRSGDDAALLHAVLARELGALRGVELTPESAAELVLRGSVTQFDRRTVAGERRIRCEVSVIVAERRGGAMRMLLTGRAEARGGSDRFLVHSAVEGAVRSALRPLAQGRLTTR